ncbi:MAG: FAD-dependent thymidylate synthase [Armatimonadetes bacterium]|nr:FAD-dependent thymidylate synthase [Candidatus Hippobium faecium]
MNIRYVGNGTVRLISGGGKIYTDIAARFCRSEKSMENIIASDYDAELVRKIVDSGHKAATEFDYFIFGVEGYARVTETQLVRKRLASYLIKSGRAEKGGKRSFDAVLPETVLPHTAQISLPTDRFFAEGKPLSQLISAKEVSLSLSARDILSMIEIWYNKGVEEGYKEEELRYLKPQATEFKAIIGMNAHALNDWFMIRCCQNAQTEIRDLADKMLRLCKEAAPALFENAGPSCKVLGYCPENRMQNEKCKGRIFTKDQAMEILKDYRKNK